MIQHMVKKIGMVRLLLLGPFFLQSRNCKNSLSIKTKFKSSKKNILQSLKVTILQIYKFNAFVTLTFGLKNEVLNYQILSPINR